ncbi:MAG: helix-turn-helix transcriptional regulator [Thermoplasmata archaeon]|nr:helix-turn-helix transcriptional regulator [Candidatus Sysuiplasma jiujiangense]MBX8640865.1 helix-turn-helix transcriptional regulator [Candidatus Sysuiplasma jiujiangense]
MRDRKELDTAVMWPVTCRLNREGCNSYLSMYQNQQEEEAQIRECRDFTAVYNQIGKKWTMPLVYALGLKRSARFNELKRMVTGISSACLSDRLSQMEKIGVLERTVRPFSPPTVEYMLTDRGIELRKILCDLATWMSTEEKRTLP